MPAYLWGIETLGVWGNICAVEGLPAYLWGIETKCHLYFSDAEMAIASLPMRNWNMLGGGEPEPEDEIASLPMRNWNISPGTRFLFVFLIASLPMRNWNLPGEKVWGARGGILPAYLWGIETYKQLYPSWHTVPSIASLPMRHFIETNSLNLNKIV